MTAPSLQQIINESQRIVFFGGAGVSTESGIPDFRSADGLYAQNYDVPPEVVLSHSYFEACPDVFFRFYREKMLPAADAKPNAAHLKLAEMEKAGQLRAVVTQNIDGLHQAAGSRHVLELHGSIHRNYCSQCGQAYPLSFVRQSMAIPRCKCGGIIRPDVVLYEEALDEDVVNEACSEIAMADALIVAGTSLSVYPAAGFLDYFRGRYIALINRTPTPFDNKADLVLRLPVGEAFSQILV